MQRTPAGSTHKEDRRTGIAVGIDTYIKKRGPINQFCLSLGGKKVDRSKNSTSCVYIYIGIYIDIC